ncbi:hypothetical protein QJS10_CPB20g00942 [Acorus calamus]|uniref:Mediator complex subunit 4 n=1 Tax=Acorus calamus TaxID=4465 RepID=A0AAV9CBJ2_ACOCL|nr:hypothetical protein QJS10_CPB20g00942 [Acorus calamus]
MDAISLALEEIESLRKCLYYLTIEKESLRTTALTELREKEERVNQLCLLLKQTTHERDEARNHLHQLQLLLHKLTQQPIDPIPPTNPIWANSSLTDSGDLSSDSAFDEVDRALAEMDRADQLVKARALPEKGRLMQAVTDAGPLLKTLLVAGPLPMWRNPPPPLERLQIPPVGLERRVLGRRSAGVVRAMEPEAKRVKA